MSSNKYYVVWNGVEPGVYDSWEECELQVKNFPGAKYRAFPTQRAAVEAYRGEADLGIFKAIGQHTRQFVNYEAFPEIRLDAIAVDGACSKNPGPMEYRGVMVGDGTEVFHVGPIDGGTNNIAEYIALIHAASLLARRGDFTTPIYSDSKTALGWLAKGHSNTKITPTPANAQIRQLLARADAWRSANRIVNPVIKWDTDRWGEIPADFGRK